ncbi:hypothetical protein MAL03_10025 [Leptospira noguchii]|uniref:Uncharacterized protein n=1 Tax=Leptospira noguchii TaxID=28182 RepID=A0AAE9GG45_9LEPT|nr:hypothetical protein [Leptospira noguchii]UOG55270.1 hypothetical protein MAL03_10025 [Leptospira noguchii]
MPILREAFAEFLGARWKLSTTLPKGRVGNSAQRFLRGALETQHNAS